MNQPIIHSEIKLLDEAGAILFETQKAETVDIAQENFSSNQYIKSLQEDIPNLLQQIIIQELFNDQQTVTDKIARVSQLQLKFEVNGELIEKTVPLKLDSGN